MTNQVNAQIVTGKKPYSAPKLVSYGNAAKLTAVKSGSKTDTAGGRGADLPPIKRR